MAPRLGLIPAYAGSTACDERGDFLKWAHPRLRGEHAALVKNSVGLMGSSPPTRGAPNTVRAELTLTGLIPAYAGSTRIPVFRRRGSGAHPRLRGEHKTLTLLTYKT